MCVSVCVHVYVHVYINASVYTPAYVYTYVCSYFHMDVLHKPQPPTPSVWLTPRAPGTGCHLRDNRGRLGSEGGGRGRGSGHWVSSRFEGESDRKYMTSRRTRSGRVCVWRPPFTPLAAIPCTRRGFSGEWTSYREQDVNGDVNGRVILDVCCSDRLLGWTVHLSLLLLLYLLLLILVLSTF